MRPLDKVLEAILKVIPDSYEKKQYLKLDFENILDSYHYAPPEALRMYWAKATQAMVVYVGTPDNHWKREVQNIFNGVVDYSDYLVN